MIIDAPSISKQIIPRMRSLRRESRGVVIIVTALVFPVLVAFLGLALDVGMMYDYKRRQQNAADAGALGGAHELWRGNTGHVTTSAKADTRRNGFDATEPAITVVVTTPYEGDPDRVEVEVSETVPVYFARVFGAETVTVRSRAVAGAVRGASGDGCVLILDKGETMAAFAVPGTGELTASCGIAVNSTHDWAMVQSGSSTITASTIGVSGGYQMNGSATLNALYIGEGMPPVEDPFLLMDPPTGFPSAAYPLRATDLIITSTPAAALEPGYYPGGITISGAGGGAPVGGGGPVGGGPPIVAEGGGTVVNFNPGVYILDGNIDSFREGGLTITGGSVNTGLGVMFYNTNTTGRDFLWGEFSISGLSSNIFRAPADGYYAGILFWNDANAPYTNPGSVITGTSHSVFEGVMYFPSTHLAFRGTSHNSGWQLIIAYTAESVGTGFVSDNFGGGFSGIPTFLKEVTLLE